MPLLRLGCSILLLAGINFVNLVTARATRRAIEVGIRKGLGAQRNQLMVQFMGEALGYSLVGMAVGVGLAALFLPSLNAFLDRQIAFDLLRHPLLAVGPVATAYRTRRCRRCLSSRDLVALSAGAGAEGESRRIDRRRQDASGSCGVPVHRDNRPADLDHSDLRADYFRHFKGAALRKGSDTYY